MRLGIDLDGVVANFTKGWMDFYNQDFGTNLVSSDSKRWNDLVELTHFADMSEFWEWSDTGYAPLEMNNEAYKLGINLFMYGITH
jgi:uncharacterized HAD superfamily protein